MAFLSIVSVISEVLFHFLLNYIPTLSQAWTRLQDWPNTDDDQDIPQSRAVEDSSSLDQPDSTNPPRAADSPISSDESNMATNLSLSHAITTNLVKNRTNQSFLPDGCLSMILEENICKAIPSTEGPLISFVTNEAPKTFATVLLAISNSEGRLVEIMKPFHSHGFTDDHLYSEDALLFTETEAKKCQHSDPFNVFHTEGWSSTSIRSFFTERWKFNAPVFNKVKFRHEFHSSTILPYLPTKEDNRETRVGGFSDVEKATIHRSHQMVLPTEPNLVVAIKRLRMADNYVEPQIAWEIESAALRVANRLQHLHLNKAIAAYTFQGSYYLVLDWASGGSLEAFWKSNDKPVLDSKLVQDVLEQLHGLSEALAQLHNNTNLDKMRTDTPGNWRHGDLKPANILRSKCSPEENHLGTLQIADLGLARYHTEVTEDRQAETSTRFGTIKYEAPEAHPENRRLNGPRPRSRRYDVWSMGCIILEFIIWLLYGYEGLKEFRAQTMAIAGVTKQDLTPFYMFMGGIFSVNCVAIRWMNTIQREDPEFQGGRRTVLGDLLEIVRSGLLIIDIKSGENSDDGEKGANAKVGATQTQYRANSAELERRLKEMIEESERDKSYLFTDADRKNVQVPNAVHSLAGTGAAGQNLSVPGIRITKSGSPSQGPTPYEETTFRFQDLNTVYEHALDDSWKFPVDNDFPLGILGETNSKGVVRPRPITKNLCERCQALNFSQPYFSLEDHVVQLGEKVQTCALCGLLHQACIRLGITEEVHLYRQDSTLRIRNIDRPLLSLCRVSNIAVHLEDIQMGFPNPPDEGDGTRFKVISQWLNHCDAHHNCSPKGPITLPTRVIKVIPDTDEDPMRLYEAHGMPGRYIALSHRWGDPATHRPCSTKRHNIKDRLERIRNSDLPKTFQDAVNITKKLGIPYLWIDSICIIQGEDGDWDDEANRMEGVFSSAYCVIAATRASGTKDGFLEPPSPREFVTLSDGSESQFYVCEAIDDFDHHVNQAELNTRGWVYQERALARRTIHFAKEQVYWECGDGIRCQTLTKMENTKAALLGDPDFPTVAAKNQSKGGVITFFEDFYKQYSRLRLTKNTDRPVAIAGLESRLIRTLGVHGGYGTFDSYTPELASYLGRSLLWMRGAGVDIMKTIQFSAKGKVPSWSWQSYEGAIDYLDVPFNQVEWERNEVHSPWAQKLSQQSSWHTTDRAGSTTLTAVAREFLKPDENIVIYDKGHAPEGQELKCVVIGRSKSEERRDSKTYYVLIVSQQDHHSWKRVGVGKFMGKDVVLKGDGTCVTIS